MVTFALKSVVEIEQSHWQWYDTFMEERAEAEYPIGCFYNSSARYTVNSTVSDLLMLS